MTLAVDHDSRKFAGRERKRVQSGEKTPGKTHLDRLRTPLFYLSIGGALFLGWQARDEQHLTAESGLGYFLGIIGATLMLLLMLYPLRKKAKFMRTWGRIAVWFRVHMILGVLGPVLVMFHANFSLGSLNSNVALAAMLTVAASGLVGRYLYARVHHGLYGRKANLRELYLDIEGEKRALGISLANVPWLEQFAADFDAQLVAQAGSLSGCARLVLSTNFATRRAARRLRREVKAAIRQEAWRRGLKPRDFGEQERAFRYRSHRYFRSMRQVASFLFYDRLFSYWRHLHLPLFLLLVGAAILHVIAVHLY